MTQMTYSSLIDPFELEGRVLDIAEHLDSVIENENEVVFCPIMQGSIPFFTDISKYCMADTYVDYIGISSYKGTQQGEFLVYKLFDTELVKGKTVWLFDDIADSGNTLKFLTDQLMQYGAKEVKTCVLLKKETCTFPVDIFGFEVGDGWMFGYGMDAPNGKGRSLTGVFCAK